MSWARKRCLHVRLPLISSSPPPPPVKILPTLVQPNKTAEPSLEEETDGLALSLTTSALPPAFSPWDELHKAHKRMQTTRQGHNCNMKRSPLVGESVFELYFVAAL